MHKIHSHSLKSALADRFRFSPLEVTPKSVRLWVASRGAEDFSPCGLSGWWGGVGPAASGPVTRGAHANFELEMGCDTQTPKKVIGPGWPSGPSDKTAASLGCPLNR